MWIRTKNNEVLEVVKTEYVRNLTSGFVCFVLRKDFLSDTTVMEQKRFGIKDVLMYGDKIEDTCEGFEGVHKNQQLLPTMWGHNYNYGKFDNELDKGFVDEIYGGYYKEIGDFEAEFIAYCKYNRAKRCFEQIEPRKDW